MAIRPAAAYVTATLRMKTSDGALAETRSLAAT